MGNFYEQVWNMIFRQMSRWISKEMALNYFVLFSNIGQG